MLDVSHCPSCGSNRIREVQRDVTREFEGRTYTVPQLTFHECPGCGETVYDPEAVRRLQAHSPAEEPNIMSDEMIIRGFAHLLLDKMKPDRLEALLDLLDEEYFSQEELEEIETLRASNEWSDWRGIRGDL